jgi:AraC-like DNA-binding protein
MTSQIVLDSSNFTDYTYVFPYIRYCNEDKYRSSWELEGRVIGDYEFILITKGTAQFVIDNRTYDVKPNDLLLIKPNVIHSGKSVELPLEFLCIHFDLFISAEKNTTVYEHRKLYEAIPGKPIQYVKADLAFPELVIIENSSYLNILLKKIIKETIEKTAGFSMVLKAMFIEFMVTLSRIIGGTGRKGTLSDELQCILDYIEKNYMNKISLSDLSGQVHLEPTYISSLFKKRMGCSITAFITLFRLSVAKKLLLESDIKIDEIAYNVGFYDLHHFSKVFRDYEGLPPSQYRELRKY